MNKKKFKLGKKNRNVLMGLVVGAASLYAVSNYVDLPGAQLRQFFLSTLLFFVLIFLIAVLFVLLIKGVPALIRKRRTRSQSSDRE